jgi:hypothetical protein
MDAVLEHEATSVDEPRHEKGRSSVRLVYLMPECVLHDLLLVVL